MHTGEMLCDKTLDLGRREIVYAQIDGHTGGLIVRGLTSALSNAPLCDRCWYVILPAFAPTLCQAAKALRIAAVSYLRANALPPQLYRSALY
jgi:hypothetical protein